MNSEEKKALCKNTRVEQYFMMFVNLHLKKWAKGSRRSLQDRKGSTCRL